MELNGARILITGGATGIGRTIAEKAVAGGAPLVADDVANLLVAMFALPDREFVSEATPWATIPR